MNARPTAAREAFVLPLIFLTVALLGGFRMLPGDAGAMRFVPPPLVGLVLAVILMGAMVRARLLVPGAGRLRARTGLVNGGVVLVALSPPPPRCCRAFRRKRDCCGLRTTSCWCVLVWNTLAAAPDRPRLLHSLFVILGSASSWHVILSSLFVAERRDARAW